MAYELYDASNLDVDGEIIDPNSLRAKFSKGNELFHADSSFNDMPSKWSILRGLTVPPEEGDTQFVDLRHVYDQLPQAMTDRIETPGRRNTVLPPAGSRAAFRRRRPSASARPCQARCSQWCGSAPMAAKRCSSLRMPFASRAWAKRKASPDRGAARLRKPVQIYLCAQMESRRHADLGQSLHPASRDRL